MKILGIIAEYNPFHNGHIYHIEQSKKITQPDYTVAVMSGNFVQRGLPAIYNKWQRATDAIKNGIDLVIELPVDFAVSSAERFAFGGVSLLNSIGATDMSFGCEDKISCIESLVEKYSDENFNKKIKSTINYATTFQQARQEILEDDGILSKPNNILAFEYIKALKSTKSTITPTGIMRQFTQHNDDSPNGIYASASYIRSRIFEGNNPSDYMPNYSSDFVSPDMFTNAIIMKIVSSNPETLKEHPEIREGLENRIYKKAYTCCSFDELVKSVKSKRYTYTAISRMLINILIDIKRDSICDTPQYLRVLAANIKGTELLNKIKKSVSIPIITTVSSYKNSNAELTNELNYDCYATDIYNLFGNKKRTGRMDYTTPPIIL